MNSSAFRHAAIRFFVPVATFMAGWSLHTAAPNDAVSSASAASPRLRPGNFRSLPAAANPRSAEPAVLSLSKRPGPAGRIASLLLHAETLDAPGTLAALKALDLQSPGTDISTARQILLARYADLDPETALTYVDTLSAEDRTTSALTIMNTWAARDPRAAAAHLEAGIGSFGISEEDAALSAAGIAATWAAQDMAAATQWVGGLSEDLRAAAIPALTGTLAATDPARAAALAAALPAGSEQAAALSSVALQWGQTDPRSTASWIRTLSDSSAQTAAAASLVNAWMQSDPSAASQWVNTLPNGALRDNAIVALTHSPAIRNDAESAVAWASSIKDVQLRESTLAPALQRQQYHQMRIAAQR